MSKKREVALWSGIYVGVFWGSFLLLEVLVFAIVPPEEGKRAGAVLLSLFAFFLSYLFASYIAQITRKKETKRRKKWKP